MCSSVTADSVVWEVTEAINCGLNGFESSSPSEMDFSIIALLSASM